MPCVGFVENPVASQSRIWWLSHCSTLLSSLLRTLWNLVTSIETLLSFSDTVYPTAASKTRKSIQHKRSKENFKLPHVTSSQSWRKQFEQTFPGILAQLQDEEPRYPVRCRTAEAQSIGDQKHTFEREMEARCGIRGGFRDTCWRHSFGNN